MRYQLLCAVLGVLAFQSAARADTVQLLNGDNLSGVVRSLNNDELTLESENFGELKIPRGKVRAIYLGDARPSPVQPQPAGPNDPPATGSDLLQNPLIQQQLGRILGNLFQNQPELRDLPESTGRARDGLRALRDDFGATPEGDALEAYLKLFDLFAPPTARPPAERSQ